MEQEFRTAALKAWIILFSKRIINDHE
jgi:hypothetical protein